MNILGLRVTIKRTAYYGFGILTLIPVVWIVGYIALFNRSAFEAGTLVMTLVVGVCFALFHEVAQFVHQLGHALTARTAGHPMTGMRYEWVFSFSEYPSNEPPLPDATHIQRSMGGVAGSGVMFVMILRLWLRLDTSTSELASWLLNFLLFDAALIFFTSAILSDGLLFVIQKPWRKQQTQQS